MGKQDTIKMLQGKVVEGLFSIDEVKNIAEMAGLDFDKEIKILNLLNEDNVKLYLELIETPDVKEYVELTKSSTPTKEHVGSKSPMPCRLCGQDSHSTSWTIVKINGLNHWVGTMKETCPKFEGQRFQIPMESGKDIYNQFPLSIGQENGRSKIETDKGYTKTGEIK